MKKENILFARRLTAFLIGTVLALGGVALVIQARLGASPSSSLPNAISIASGIPLSRVILMVYAVEIAAQFVLRGKERQWRDLLQIPVALFQSFLLDRFQTLGLFSYDLLCLFPAPLLPLPLQRKAHRRHLSHPRLNSQPCLRNKIPQNKKSSERVILFRSNFI